MMTTTALLCWLGFNAAVLAACVWVLWRCRCRPVATRLNSCVVAVPKELSMAQLSARVKMFEAEWL